jgi:hypothetical protein
MPRLAIGSLFVLVGVVCVPAARAQQRPVLLPAPSPFSSSSS